MKSFQPLSFGLGLVSGILVLVLFAGGMRILHPASQRAPQTNRGSFQQRQGGTGAPNTARMAQRFGMTEEELRSALANGKTMQDIAKEKGIEFPGGQSGRRNQTGGEASSIQNSAASSQSSQSAQSSSVQS